jgi:8-oxo-dGTP diphosphatase
MGTQTRVVAGIIVRDGKVLICQRKAGQAHEFKWEFPGGKIESGEEPAAALARELEEELAIHAAIGREVTHYEYAYPGKKPILLIFFRVAGFTGEPRNRVFEQMAWAEPVRLPTFDFLEGDIDFVRALATDPSILVLMGSGIKLVEPAENAFLAEMEGKAKKPIHFFRAMANRPDVLKNFVPFYGAIMGPGSVDRRTKELVFLTCSYANACPYCLAAHTASGRKAGITDAEMAVLAAGGEEGFSEVEQVVIRYARELTKTANAPASREALRAHFNDEQVVEITLIAATANWTNRFNNGLQLMPEA